MTPNEILNNLQWFYEAWLEDSLIDIIRIKDDDCLMLGAPSKWETHGAHDTRLYCFYPRGNDTVDLIIELVAGDDPDRIESTIKGLSLSALMAKFGFESSTKKSRARSNYRR